MLKRHYSHFMKEAVKEARKGLREGGILIGSVLITDGKIINLPECKKMMAEFIVVRSKLWNEDIGI